MSKASTSSENTPYVPDITLDRSSPVPLYFQISEPIAQLINSGALPADTRLEDELSMAARLHVSRPTARQALQRLVDRGLLTRRRGVGTIVSPRHVHRPMELTSLMRDLVNAGHKVHTTIQRYEARPANAQEADVLKITEGTLIVHIERTRFANDEPIAVLTNFIPTDIAPTMQELESASLYDLMRERGVTLASARQVIGARSATTKEAKLLSEHRGAALLTTQRTTYDPSGRIVEYGDHIYRASRYSFEASLFAQ
jgi:hypothetical protein